MAPQPAVGNLAGRESERCSFGVFHFSQCQARASVPGEEWCPGLISRSFSEGATHTAVPDRPVNCSGPRELCEVGGHPVSGSARGGKNVWTQPKVSAQPPATTDTVLALESYFRWICRKKINNHHHDPGTEPIFFTRDLVFQTTEASARRGREAQCGRIRDVCFFGGLPPYPTEGTSGTARPRKAPRPSAPWQKILGSPSVTGLSQAASKPPSPGRARGGWRRGRGR